MKLPTPYIVIWISLLEFVLSDGSVTETCDVEGSGLDDCPVDTYCCIQSKCDTIFNPNDNPDKRCCTKAEREKTPKPNNCMLCTECCDETERNAVPIPDRCSKCRRCKGAEDRNDLLTGYYLMRYSSFKRVNRISYNHW